MVDITPIFNAEAFDPETVRTMTHAFEDRPSLTRTTARKPNEPWPSSLSSSCGAGSAIRLIFAGKLNENWASAIRS